MSALCAGDHIHIATYGHFLVRSVYANQVHRSVPPVDPLLLEAYGDEAVELGRSPDGPRRVVAHGDEVAELEHLPRAAARATAADIDRHMAKLTPEAREVAQRIRDATAKRRSKLQERYSKREASAVAEQRASLAQNRVNAVRPVETPDGVRHVASCACRWHGLQHADPELARREYDAHPCSVLDGDRIHREFVGLADKHAASAMVPATAEERAKAGVSLPGEAAVAPTVSAGDEAEQRFALLELDRK